MSMLKKIKKNKVTEDLTKYKFLVAGRPKIGKTSLFSELLKYEGDIDDGLLIAFEVGYNFIDGINAVDIEEWEDFVDLIDELEELKEDNGSAPYKFAGIDTVDVARKLCQSYVLKKRGREIQKNLTALNQLGYGEGHELLETEWDTQMARLNKLGMGLFYITHDKDRQVEEQDGTTYEKTSTSVTGRVGDSVKNDSDFIIFIDVKKTKNEKTDEVIEERFIRFRGDGTTEAGGRIKHLPETIPYDVELFLSEVKKAIAITIKEGEVTSKKSKVESKKEDKPKKKTKEKEVVDENDEDLEEELTSVKNKILKIAKNMDGEEKEALKPLFKKKLGIVNFKNSNDLEKLKEVLEELENN